MTNTTVYWCPYHLDGHTVAVKYPCPPYASRHSWIPSRANRPTCGLVHDDKARILPPIAAWIIRIKQIWKLKQESISIGQIGQIGWSIVSCCSSHRFSVGTGSYFSHTEAASDLMRRCNQSLPTVTQQLVEALQPTCLVSGKFLHTRIISFGVRTG